MEHVDGCVCCLMHDSGLNHASKYENVWGSEITRREELTGHNDKVQLICFFSVDFKTKNDMTNLSLQIAYLVSSLNVISLIFSSVLKQAKNSLSIFRSVATIDFIMNKNKKQSNPLTTFNYCGHSQLYVLVLSSHTTLVIVVSSRSSNHFQQNRLWQSNRTPSAQQQTQTTWWGT